MRVVKSRLSNVVVGLGDRIAADVEVLSTNDPWIVATARELQMRDVRSSGDGQTRSDGDQVCNSGVKVAGRARRERVIELWGEESTPMPDERAAIATTGHKVGAIVLHLNNEPVLVLELKAAAYGLVCIASGEEVQTLRSALGRAPAR